MDSDAIGERIKRARERKYVGQAELAQMAGLSIATLWTLEKGRHRPRPATLRKIAAALGMSMDELIGDP